LYVILLNSQEEIVDIKIDLDSIKKKLQPVVEQAGIEHVQKLVNKLFTGEEKRQLTIKLVSGKVAVTGPQELLDRLKSVLK
jgi:hypothetical protein